ncbi:MAG: hypothetical protein HYZ96_01115 [Candidatus Omnitrophica bacterium]|nr:hypothetical protein [Candidatus Omnitrophota bacterium]
MPAARVPIPRQVEPLLRAIGQLADQRGMRAYAVGGCVRDWLLGLTDTPDLDVTVEGDGIAIARAAGRILNGTLTVHQQFGTATRRLRRGRGGHPAGSLRVDFATCRRETYARSAAYPRVAAGTLEDDLFRRDFTINAMAAALSPIRFGALVDPFQGARDLRRRRLRILHARSFLDDPSRLLRGIRFAQRFGLRWEPATRRAAREAVAAGALGWLNAGRLRRELDRMREEPDPLACVGELAALLDSSTDTA